jgi:GNAT superfamily N-acetyltransferase
MPDWTLRRLDGEETLGMLDELADAYIEGYADDPDAGRFPYTRDAFVERTTGQARSPGFTLIAGHWAAELAGFSFGLPFTAGRWWRGAEGEAPAELVNTDNFAVIELVVLPRFRDQGLAGRLFRTLLADRPEPYATLVAEKRGRARAMYDRWGWRAVQSDRPSPDVAELDVLVKQLG